MGNSLGTTFVPDWQMACAAKFNCNSSGLVGINGQPTFPTCPAGANISDDVWGITAQVCHEACGIGTIRQSIDFTNSAITLTTWLLPWLALIAQLPFEAEGWMNLVSGCLAVGSPALATYSLALTAFNRWYIFREFGKLRDRVHNFTEHSPHRSYLSQRLAKVSFIRVEVQQCPMRANQRDGELAGLLLIDDRARKSFWDIAWKDLKNTRRGFEYSFLAQVLMAALAYLFAFVGAVHESLGSPEVGFQFASSMLWTWMFPVVYGYVQVGSQGDAGSIDEALTHNKAIPMRDRDDFMHQMGLLPTADFPLKHRAARRPGEPEDMFDVRGDERRKGPIFNYGRIFTWFAFSNHVYRVFENAISKLEQHHDRPVPSTPEEAAALCDFQIDQELKVFEGWNASPAAPVQHILGAALIALFLQWGTTGAAMFLAYRTPPVGLGCRSGSYLLYGTAATVSWLLLVFAQLASHGYMHRVEHDKTNIASSLLGALAVFLRLTGKLLAICNAGWIIASNVLEDIGAFEMCWCQTNGLSMARTGWAPVFKTESELANAAEAIWIGGFVWSITVCAVTMAFFAYPGDKGKCDVPES